MPSPRLPLVLLPGLLNDARLWMHAVGGLADMCTPIVVELTEGRSMAQFAQRVLAQVDEPRFALAGFSMGGYTAFEVMRQAPSRVLGLALIDTSARPDTPEATRLRREAVARASRDFDGVVDAMLHRLAHPDRVHDPEVAEPFRAMAQRIGPAAFARQQEAIITRPDSRPTLAHVACPALVLCGRDDPVTPVEVHEEMRDGIAHASFVVLGRCGHLAPLERPDEVTSALRDFLERVPQ